MKKVTIKAKCGYFFDLSADNTPKDRQPVRHGHNKAVHFVVAQVNLHYHTPLFVDDELTVCIDTLMLRPASLLLKQSIYRHNQTKAATTADIVLACVQNDGQGIRPHRLPKVFIDALASKA